MKKDFLNPSSIAVIGASEHKEKIGFIILKNILDGGFSGKVYPINPDAENIIGLKCYPNVFLAPKNIDMAVIAVPAEIVPKVMLDCGKKGIKNVVIISAGFSEIGKVGKEREEAIKNVANIYNMNILGPNCLGIIDPINRLNISFATNMPEKKDIAVISQSGATCTAILDWAKSEGIGFSHFISLGNKIDLNENDFLENFAEDKNTKVILAYLESISEGPEFVGISKGITKEKPLIVLKAGRSVLGAKAASSHTGALASDDAVVNVAFDEAGITRAESLEDFFEWGMAFSNLKHMAKEKVMVITNAGGPGVMATDAICESKVLDLYKMEGELKSKIEKRAKINVANPLDLLGDATSLKFEIVLGELSKEEAYKIVLITPQANTDIDKIAQKIIAKNDQQTVVVLMGGERFVNAKKMLSKARIPVFDYPERAAKAIEELVKYSKYKNKRLQKEVYTKTFKKVAENVFLKQEDLTDSDLAKILSAYHIPMADSKITLSAEEAIKTAERIGYPVVLKVTSPDILHKTEVGAIKLGIQNADELRSSYQEVLKNAKKHFPKAQVLGVAVYKMVRSKVEVALGAKRDPVFGPVVMFGLGGIYIELLKDFSLKLAPISIGEAKEMIDSIKAHEILEGFRNGEKFDVEAIAEAISGLSQLMVDFPQIKEIDINPLKVEGEHKGVLALDAKIISERAKILV